VGTQQGGGTQIAREFGGAVQAPKAERMALPHVTRGPEAQHVLAEQVRTACAAWFSQAAIVQRHEADFGLRLARCQTPSEAVRVCGEWLAHRLDSAVAMHHRFLELWMTFATAAPNGVDEAAQPRTTRDAGSSP
jgi:hypothetical protein